MVKWFHDSETYATMHSQQFISENGERKLFYLTKDKNNMKGFEQFYLDPENIFIGYNNLYYDHPLAIYVIRNSHNLDCRNIKTMSDNLIQNRKFTQYDERIIDLYLICHFDNRAKATSLKWLQGAMHWPDLRDLPYPPDLLLNQSQIEEVIEYCWNDVLSTKAFYEAIKTKVDFHKVAKATFNLASHNFNDVKIGEAFMKTTYEEKSGKQVKDEKTYRSILTMKDLFPNIFEFSHPNLQYLLKDLQTVKLILKNKKVTEERTGKAFERRITLANRQYDMKVGGLHSIDNPMDYSTDETHYLEDIDVRSMYPYTIINWGYYPEHLGKEWLEAYKTIADKRIYHKKMIYQSEKTEKAYHQLNSDVLKLALNGGGFGKTNSEHSWQYDPKVTFSTTITGQLSILMLIDRMIDNNIQVLSANTDGILIYTHKKNKELVQSICRQWEKETKYQLEHTYYERYFGRDVNNYLVIKEGGKTKEKGAYEVDRLVGKQIAWHKDHSMRVVRLAVREYLLHGTPLSDTIINHDNIYDFCFIQRGKASPKKGKSHFVFEEYCDGMACRTDVGKTIRYYASNTGGNIIKVWSDGSESQEKKESKHTLFNLYEEKEDYDINYTFYVNEAMKLLTRKKGKTTIILNQLKLL